MSPGSQEATVMVHVTNNENLNQGSCGGNGGRVIKELFGRQDQWTWMSGVLRERGVLRVTDTRDGDMDRLADST